MIYIIADDLTGANDTGVQYKRCGLRTLISADMDLTSLDDLDDKFDVISINANTRTQRPQDAYHTTYDLVKNIQAKEHKYIYKKVDSLLRGNAAQELEAVMDALGASISIVATSYPENGRTLCNGVLSLSEPNGTKYEVDVSRVFADGMERSVQAIGFAVVQQGVDALYSAIRRGRSEGAQVFVIDSITDEDLAVVRDAALALKEKTVFCGSAGLAKQLSLLTACDVQVNKRSVAESGVTLVLIGSRNGCTAEQVQALADKTGMPVIKILTADILKGKSEEVKRELLQQVDGLINGGCGLLAVVVDTLFTEYTISLKDSERAIKDSQKISETIGGLAALLYDCYHINVILSSGGDTSLSILKALEAKGIELDAEIVPGVPVGRLIGGKADGMTIVTKSGGFGQKDSLIRTIEYLAK